MDEKIKAVHGASATAEKDEAIYNLLKQTQLDIVNGIQKFQEKHKKLSCSLDASGCRLKNNDSLITIHENKHLFPQIVVDDETDSSVTKREQMKPEKVPSLADYVFNSVKYGLSMVNQKQICVDIHSDVDDTIYKVFEDVNPYLARDLPPLIGSDEFYTGDYAKPKQPASSEHIDDVIVQIPRTHIQIASPKLDTLTTNIPAEIPKSIPPALMNNMTPISVPQDVHSPASSVDRESVKIDKLADGTDSEDKSSISKSIDDSDPLKENLLHDKVEEESKGSQVKPPPNLAEIVKRGPPVNIPKRIAPVSLFSDDDEAEEDTTSIEKPQSSPISNKPPPVPVIPPPKVVPPPRAVDPGKNKDTVLVVPQAPPRAAVPKSTDNENMKLPTPIVKSEEEVPVESQIKKEVKPAPVARQNVSKPPPTLVVRNNPKVKSLFSSSSDESDTEVKPKEVKTNVIVPKTSPVPKLNNENHVEPPEVVENVVKQTVETAKVATPEKKAEVAESKSEVKEPPRKSLFDDDSDSQTPKSILSSESKPTPTPEAPKVPPTRTQTVRRPIFDDSDSDDDFFTKPKAQIKPPEKKSPAVSPSTNNTVQKSSTRPTVRKSMFSSSDSD